MAARCGAARMCAAQHPRPHVLIPWRGGRSAATTSSPARMMEVVVHGEDVAASVGFTSPPLPDDVLSPVVHLLTRPRRAPHGQGAVVSALSRAERAPRTIAAF